MRSDRHYVNPASYSTDSSAVRIGVFFDRKNGSRHLQRNNSGKKRTGKRYKWGKVETAHLVDLPTWFSDGVVPAISALSYNPVQMC